MRIMSLGVDQLVNERSGIYFLLSISSSFLLSQRFSLYFSQGARLSYCDASVPASFACALSLHFQVGLTAVSCVCGDNFNCALCACV